MIEAQIRGVMSMWAAALELALDDINKGIEYQRRTQPYRDVLNTGRIVTTADGRKVINKQARHSLHYYKSLAWVYSDAEHIGSFWWCCEVTGLDRSKIRGSVARMLIDAGYAEDLVQVTKVAA